MTSTTGTDKNYTLSQADTNVMLDSGTTLTRLHSTLAAPILRDLGATVDSDGYYLARCSMRSTRATVNFGFGNGAIVRVPLSDFILEIGRGAYCYIGLVLTEDQQILGDSFMRAGYFVFDWDNQNVHIAQAANCGTEIVTVGSGTSAVPSLTGNCAGTAALPSSTAAGASTRSVRIQVFPLFFASPIDSPCRQSAISSAWHARNPSLKFYNLPSGASTNSS
jgi:hypothetical protein